MPSLPLGFQFAKTCPGSDVMSQAAAVTVTTCPTFELACQNYISDSKDKSESERRKEEVNSKKLELYRRALAARAFKCSCDFCFFQIWNLSA